MRLTLIVTCCALLGASSAHAAITPAETDRLREAASVLTSLKDAPDHDIPTEVANRVACTAVIPGVKKAAFIVGGEYGKGVMSCRTAQGWSAPVFMRLAKGSWGFQIGAQEVDLVLLIMNRRGAERLLNNKVTLGADLSVAAGPVGRTAHAGTDAQLTAEILSYSRARGLFAGVDISGGVLGPDEDANEHVYGEKVTPREIVDGGVKPPPAAAPFLAAVRDEFGVTATPSARR
jgi:lipid-binding SYLF domain-containing protein